MRPTRWESVTASAHYVTAHEAEDETYLHEGDLILTVEVQTRAGEWLGRCYTLANPSALRVNAYAFTLDGIVRDLTIAGDGIVI